MSQPVHTKPSELADQDVVERICAGDLGLFEELMRRYNQRLYRVVRAILKDDPEVEDVMQQAYIQAYKHLRQFAGRAQLGTWLTRIAIHEALGRRRRRQPLTDSIEQEGAMSQQDTNAADPERLVYAGEL